MESEIKYLDNDLSILIDNKDIYKADINLYRDEKSPRRCKGQSTISYLRATRMKILNLWRQVDSSPWMFTLSVQDMIIEIFIIQKLGLEMIALMSKALTKIFLVKLKQLQLQVVSHGGLEVFSLLVTPNHFFWNHNYES